jgi:23S rRNA pseudouridine1911/1915/1917 synthase
MPLPPKRPAPIAESSMSSENQERTISVPEKIDPVRLDKFLASLKELDLSRSYIQQVIADGLVRVDGGVVEKKYRLKGGETIEMVIRPPEKIDLSPENIPLDIVYDDEYLAVVNKVAGLVVHPAPGNLKHTLVNALLYHFGRISEDAADIRPGIVHRLDKNTSGLLLVAKSEVIARRLRRQMANRKITKVYHAVICGHAPENEGTIDLPIGRSIRDRRKMIVTRVASRDAVTHYRVLKRFRYNDYVEVRIETGRTHQIRVHLSHRNRPVLGDPDYGGRTKWLRMIDPSARRAGERLLETIDRQALHAKTLVFEHPETGKEMRIDSELPDDFTRLLRLLEKYYR